MPLNCNHLYDKKGRQILVGDLLKIFHFVDTAGRKRYMYKHVIKYEPFTKKRHALLKLSHLGAKQDSFSYYHETCDGSVREDIEIVQGFGMDYLPFDKRPAYESVAPLCV
jgi:hypothetical protein